MRLFINLCPGWLFGKLTFCRLTISASVTASKARWIRDTRRSGQSPKSQLNKTSTCHKVNSFIKWKKALVNVFGKLTFWQVDNLASWQFGKLTFWQVDFLASWLLASWLYGKLTLCQAVFLASCLFGKLTFWKFTISPTIT
jgi:hypothetical protein